MRKSSPSRTFMSGRNIVIENRKADLDMARTKLAGKTLDVKRIKAD